MESIKFIGMLAFILGVYALMGDDDYHKMVDKPTIIRYNCNDVISSWNPNVPDEVVRKCNESNERIIRVKTY